MRKCEARISKGTRQAWGLFRGIPTRARTAQVEGVGVILTGALQSGRPGSPVLTGAL